MSAAAGADNLQSAVNATTYATRPSTSTARNPSVIESIVVSTDPITEQKPLTAHAHAT